MLEPTKTSHLRTFGLVCRRDVTALTPPWHPSQYTLKNFEDLVSSNCADRLSRELRHGLIERLGAVGSDDEATTLEN